MTEITLSAEQESILSAAEGLVAIRRPDGSVLGWISARGSRQTSRGNPFGPEEIAAAAAEANGPGPWRTTKEVLEGLRSLDRPAS